ncbi:YgaB family protein [Mesobacillus jeotgali]|jgi:DNA mismatch repair ATPase MutS|uniref:YgaB family protein n=1 Tax=Mesobacillus jeotgali TaxID=129985 RepID=A0ABY9VSD3_9BACI|nr:YgaB family protein [Mesobacillus jeotgali]WNF23881.1 YgaB family protein [Mesobacillus jeotgali]
MDKFNELVFTQMQTMEKLLYLQSELERCQEIEKQLDALKQSAELEELRMEIDLKKQDLQEIHRMFEKQTEEVIHTYQELAVTFR